MSYSRYHRQMLLPEIGLEGQRKLANSSVIIVGAGGLGSFVAPLLVGGGVGRITLVDDDKVDLSNLHRQPFFIEEEQGQSKANCLVQRLSLLNSSTFITAIPERLTLQNCDILSGYDLVVDATDNLSTRLLIAQYCQSHSIPLVVGAVGAYRGWVSLFNLPQSQRTFDNFLEAFSFGLNEDDKSIMGSVVAVVGGVVAHEVVKCLLDMDELLVDSFWTIDMQSMESFILRY